MNPNSAKALELITSARVQLITDHPFFGHLALRLRLREVPANHPVVSTMATDGVSLLYNPDFVVMLGQRSFSQVVGVVCHETLHCAFAHSARMIHLDETMQRHIACDLAINPIIRDAGREVGRGYGYTGGGRGSGSGGRVPIELPPEGVFPEQFGFEEGLSAEEYYHLLGDLMEEVEQQVKGQCCSGALDMPCEGKEGQEGQDKKEEGEGEGDGEEEGDGDGDHTPKRLPSASEIAQMQAEWRQAVQQAAQVARMAGQLPVGMDILLDKLNAPVVDWRDQLRRFMTERSKDDYSSFPPNRRFVHMGLYLPSIRANESLGDVVVAFDMSGSTDGFRELFFNEFRGICEETVPRRVHVVSFDAQVHNHVTFTPEDYPITSERAGLRGGGGTSFFPIFEHVDRCVRDGTHGVEGDVACVIVLTDMYGDGWPGERARTGVPAYPVLWASTTDVVAPVGETIRITR